MNLLPRPIRTWARNRRRLRFAIDRHPLPVLADWEKRDELVRWARQSGVDVFIETGTYRGATALALREVVGRVVTIEIDTALHARAEALFAGRPGIELLRGDSAALLPGVLARLDQPALFW